MSSGSSGSNSTLVVAGPDTIQVQDFYVHASILHPLVVGSIAIIVLFTSLRIISNRSIAAMNVTDWIANVAIGSTLAGVVNGNSLVRGMLGLVTILGFQYLTSFVGCRLPSRLEWMLSSPPLVIAFRGRLLTKVLTTHRISLCDFYTALRQKNVLSVKDVECVFIEANGSFSIYLKSQVQDVPLADRGVLLQVPGYKALCDDAEERHVCEDKEGGIGGGPRCEGCDEVQNKLARDAC